MKWLTRFIRIRWLRHQVRIWDEYIADERKRHEEFDKRMRSWYRQRAPYAGELQRLEGKVSAIDWHGGCNQAWRGK
jgi:hypothetical protein